MCRSHAPSTGVRMASHAHAMTMSGQACNAQSRRDTRPCLTRGNPPPRMATTAVNRGVEGPRCVRGGKRAPSSRADPAEGMCVHRGAHRCTPARTCARCARVPSGVTPEALHLRANARGKRETPRIRNVALFCHGRSGRRCLHAGRCTMCREPQAKQKRRRRVFGPSASPKCAKASAWRTV